MKILKKTYIMSSKMEKSNLNSLVLKILAMIAK